MAGNDLAPVPTGANLVLEPVHEDPLTGFAQSTVKKLIAKDFGDPNLDIFSYGSELKGFIPKVQQYDEERLANFSTLTQEGKNYGVVVTAGWTTAPGRKDDLILRICELSPEEKQTMQSLSQITDIHQLESKREDLMLSLVQRINKGAGSMVIWSKEGKTFRHTRTQGSELLQNQLDAINASLQNESRVLHSFDIVRTVDERPTSKRTMNGEYVFSSTLGWQPQTLRIQSPLHTDLKESLETNHEPYELLASGVRRLMIPLKLGDFQGSHIREVVVLKQHDSKLQKQLVTEVDKTVRGISDFPEGAKIASDTVEQICSRDQKVDLQTMTKYLHETHGDFHNGILIIPVGELSTPNVANFTLSFVENSPEASLVAFCQSHKVKLVFVFSESEYTNYLESTNEQMPGTRPLQPVAWIEE